MSIREWYGVVDLDIPTTEINSCIDGLLELYADAIKQYFSIDAKSFQTILLANPNDLNQGQKLFQNWLCETGFPYLRQLASSSLPDDSMLISKVDYEKYILEQEMDFKYPEDVRSLLIGIVSDMPEYIAASKEILVTVDIEGAGKWLGEYSSINAYKPYNDIFFKDPYKMQGNEYYTSNYNESAVNAGSLFLFIFRRKINENNGLLQTNK